jgi:hypothetical protein
LVERASGLLVAEGHDLGWKTLPDHLSLRYQPKAGLLLLEAADNFGAPGHDLSSAHADFSRLNYDTAGFQSYNSQTAKTYTETFMLNQLPS